MAYRVYNRVCFNRLIAVIDKQLLYRGRETINMQSSMGLSMISADQTRKIDSIREQLRQNIQKYFASFTTRKGVIDFLSLTHPDRISIHVDNNDYLNLSFDPELVISDTHSVTPDMHKRILQNSTSHMQTVSVRRQGSDNIMSGVFLQHDCLQHQLSALLAKQILGKECVYLAQSGYAANYGLLQSIVIPATTHVYIDAAAHESLWQGASRGIIHKIKHNSLEDLEQHLRKFGSGIIVVDSLYSAKGSIADLVELCNLKESYDCMLVVDESHSIGLYGPHGRGLAALANVTSRIDFITGSLAKAYCVRAGFVAGRAQEVLYVRENSSASIFSSALMTWDLQRLQRAMTIIYNADKKRQRLMEIATVVRHAAVRLNFDVEQPPLPSPILCLIGGPNPFSKKLQIYFEDVGISGAIFVAPATPVNRSLLRLTLHAGLSDGDVSQIISTLESIAKYHRADLPHTFLKH
ncbi:unnamed protein product [Adineta ricciae]|uniref:Aminotransferase class I/classII large domain-containing protein n=1 Tax=Adineta ricciae TaxID=249248 RepID=A0A815RLT1_ADIRI|nr:unnamed protein product [Adineta ricciae]CAF1479457.1 unnamed protein product [Adineta ricciae]